jgi:putative Holliday junction resolvase
MRPHKGMRALGVDPGEKYIGLAVSDATGLIARPLATLSHSALARDALLILSFATKNAADLIVVGWALDSEGQPGPAARHAERLADELRRQTALPVVLHDESFSSVAGGESMRLTGRTRGARRAKIHGASAAALLQSYLDATDSD